MQEALYHPRFGYYAAGIRTIGSRGDFATWPSLDKSLAKAIARWLREHRPRRGSWNVIEIGAGTGALARDVLSELGWWRRPKFHIVEVSPPLRGIQQETPGLRGTSWHANPASALHACGGDALIFCNELVDAFPCRIFRRAANGWEELHIRLENGRAGESWLLADELPESTAFAQEWPLGQRVETQQSFSNWLSGWLPAWTSGRMLLIDYGDICPQIYAGRPGGTLRAYAFQQRFAGHEALDGFGRRDLTVDVNFSDLLCWSETWGLNSHGPTHLHGFVGHAHPMGVAAAEAFNVLELIRD